MQEAVLEAGSVRALNVKNVLIRNVLDAALLAWPIGPSDTASIRQGNNVRQEWRGGWS